MGLQSQGRRSLGSQASLKQPKAPPSALTCTLAALDVLQFLILLGGAGGEVSGKLKWGWHQPGKGSVGGGEC